MNDVDERLAAHAARWQGSVALPTVQDDVLAPGTVTAPSRLRSFRLLGVAAGIAVVAVVATLALRPVGSDARRTPVAGSAPRATPTPSAVRVAADDLDRYVAADAAFFRPFSARGGASEAEYYQSLHDAYRAAGVVVIAQVTEVRPTRTFGSGADAVPYAGVVLRPVEVLRGALRDPSAELVVEFAADARLVSETVPKGYGVWFLRNKADAPPGRGKGVAPAGEAAYYRLVSSQGLYVAGDGHVVDPVREQPGAEAGGPAETPAMTRDPVAREAEAFTTLSALVAHLRTLG